MRNVYDFMGNPWFLKHYLTSYENVEESMKIVKEFFLKFHGFKGALCFSVKYLASYGI